MNFMVFHVSSGLPANIFYAPLSYDQIIWQTNKDNIKNKDFSDFCALRASLCMQQNATTKKKKEMEIKR